VTNWVVKGRLSMSINGDVAIAAANSTDMHLAIISYRCYHSVDLVLGGHPLPTPPLDLAVS